MNTNAELRANWRRDWLFCIYEFASIKLQRMSWIKGPSANWPNNKQWCSHFSECYCTYFDDLVLNNEQGGYAACVKEGLVSQEEANLATKFHEMADNYTEPSDEHEDILSDPKWHKVTNSASQLWHNLKEVFTSEYDMNTVKELETTYGEITNEKRDKSE